MILIINNSNGELEPKIIQYIKSTKIPFKEATTIKDIDSAKNVTHIILTGSPLMVNEKDILNNKQVFYLNIYAIKKFPKIPILGICFGCQLINILWGGELKQLKQGLKTTIPITFNQNKVLNHIINPLTQEFQFNCNYVLKNIPKTFKEIAHINQPKSKSINHLPCIIKHKTLPIYGILAHPELLESSQWFLEQFLKKY